MSFRPGLSLCIHWKRMIATEKWNRLNSSTKQSRWILSFPISKSAGLIKIVLRDLVRIRRRMPNHTVWSGWENVHEMIRACVSDARFVSENRENTVHLLNVFHKSAIHTPQFGGWDVAQTRGRKMLAKLLIHRVTKSQLHSSLSFCTPFLFKLQMARSFMMGVNHMENAHSKNITYRNISTWLAKNGDAAQRSGTSFPVFVDKSVFIIMVIVIGHHF